MDLRSLSRTCGGTGWLDCECGGDFCVCTLYGGMDCPGCKDCRDSDCYDDDYPDEPADEYAQADRRCEKVAPGQCNLAGSTYCEFHCPYHWSH